MSETIAIAGKSVKLFKGHYSSWFRNLGYLAAAGHSQRRSCYVGTCGCVLTQGETNALGR
ncbi:MAG: hypothetical protein ACREYE_20275 [Gammaproteobacteria bacterium]